MRAIILAGGRGTRLLPYTTIVPKPLLPVGDRPIVEILIRQLKHHGFTRVTLALGHLAHLVQAVLGDGNQLGVQVDYSVEQTPLGTSGPLKLIDGLDETFLVVNGDVLTDLDYTDLLSFHCSSGFTLTVASHRRTVHVDYGVIESEGNRIVAFREKPTIELHVSAGVYLFEPKALGYVEPGQYLDFPDLVTLLLSRDEPVGCYPFGGIWYDLGRSEDFQRVHESYDELKNTIPCM
jgi:NDP-mannose synthase